MVSGQGQVRTRLRGIAVTAVLAVVPALSGCGNFFVYPGSGSGGTGTSGGDFAYVANNATASTSISAYSLSSGALTALTGSPFSIGITPAAMAVTPNDSLLFIASSATSASNPGLIYSWTINSTSGVISINNNGNAVGGGVTNSQAPVSLAVSPNGNYLFELDAANGILNEYAISSNGTLGGATGVPCSVGAPVAAEQVIVAPSGNYVVCAMGGGGEVVYPFNQSTGALGTSYNIPSGTTFADYAITMDSNNYLYIARNGQLALYNLGGTSPTTMVLQVATASLPGGITLDRTGGYVYVANYSTSTISAFSITSSGSTVTLTPLTGSPYSTATNVTAVAPDNSGKYFMALGYNATNGIQLYSLSAGVPTATGNVAGSGSTTTVPAVMALTH